MGNHIGNVSIESTFYQLDLSTQIIKEAIVSLWNKCECTFDTKCRHCMAKDFIESTEQITKPLKTINKNTFYPVLFIDAFAMKEALENYGNPIESVDILPMWHDSNKEPNDANPDYFIMVIHYSRYAMNPNGFYIGYENVTFEMKLYTKKEFNLHGIPYNLSHLVCIPNCDQLEIVNCNLPDEELPDESHHESDCEVFNRSLLRPWNPEKEPFADDCTCGCNDEWEGYSHPDDDLFYQEMDSIFYIIMNGKTIPEAKFDATKSEWTLGDQSYVVGQPLDEWWLG
jgi:hypothetical protein